MYITFSFSFSLVPLTVIVPRQEVSVNEGESVNLTCSFNYGQSLIVIWSTETVGLLTTVSNKVGYCLCVHIL